jgi:hypothetical protein
MMFLIIAAVSLFFNSLFLIPAAWNSFLHSGGMFRIYPKEEKKKDE